MSELEKDMNPEQENVNIPETGENEAVLNAEPEAEAAAEDAGAADEAAAEDAAVEAAVEDAAVELEEPPQAVSPKVAVAKPMALRKSLRWIFLIVVPPCFFIAPVQRLRQHGGCTMPCRRSGHRLPD